MSQATDAATLENILAAAAAAARPAADERPRPSAPAGWSRPPTPSTPPRTTSSRWPHAETHLPATPRLAGELKRTTFQLRLFGEVLTDGEYLGATVDHADPDWPMGPRPDIRRVKTAIGPVLVFAASNFPFAFSVAGGDTASALAAGCPVIVKAHPGHPELSALTGRIVREALIGAGAPEGIFDVIFGQEEGVTALKDPRLARRVVHRLDPRRARAVRHRERAAAADPVLRRARQRQPGRGHRGRDRRARGSRRQGLRRVVHPRRRAVLHQAGPAVPAGGPQPDRDAALGAGRRRGPADAERPHRRRVRRRSWRSCARCPGVEVVSESASSSPAFTPTLLATSGKQFLEGGAAVHEECFGPASLIVTYADQAELLRLLDVVEPGLTATIHGEESDVDWIRPVLPALARVAGRLLWNDWPTGVTVSWAQQHGGPYPATTAPTTTSVGTAAIERFLRPIAWQGFPDALLPEPLQEANPWQLPRRTDGTR